MVLATMRVVEGTGEGVVLACGDDTVYGSFLQKANENKEIGVPFRKLIRREIMRTVLLSASCVFSGILVFGVGLNIPHWIALWGKNRMK
mmetsp:Transcript_27802/g.65904  ORF Transcript_27802/g.65904 Transcript_27802/m.65904 type:complete len:89 (-) Transcript_27802:666-932(-)